MLKKAPKTPLGFFAENKNPTFWYRQRPFTLNEPSVDKTDMKG